ncbi:MAG: hypothetical protein V4451_16165 [Pseudomonadota bacterium]
MNQLAIDFAAPSFIHTRARRNDSDTSKEAAKHAATRKADQERLAIAAAVKAAPAGRTAREVAFVTEIDYIEVQRRISECGLIKTSVRREGCAVWAAAPVMEGVA